MTTKPKRKYKHLSNTEWDSIIGIYSCGAVSLSELATKHGVSVSAIMHNAKARGATRRGALPATAALTAITAASKITTSTTAGHLPRSLASTEDKIKDTNEAAYADAEAIQRVLRTALAALPTPSSPAELAATVRCMDQAASTLDKCNKIRRLVLRLDRENLGADVVLPELPIMEMSQLEVDQMRAAQSREDQELGLDAAEPDDDEAELPEPPDEDDEVVTIGGD